MTEKIESYKTNILSLIGTLIDNQNDKGIRKYGQSLEKANHPDFDWQAMLIEELIDALQYQQKEISRLNTWIGTHSAEAMTFHDFQELSKRTIPNESRKNVLSNYSMGIAGEAGEVVDLFKKHLHHGHTLDELEVLNEIGDVLHYAAGLATIINWPLESAARMNIDKLEKRYPNGFSKEDSINRSE